MNDIMDINDAYFTASNSYTFESRISAMLACSKNKATGPGQL